MNIIKKSLILVITLSIYSCSGDNSSNTTTVNNSKYIGPGSIWNVVLDNDNNTFNITRQNDINSTIDNTITGSFAKDSSGFIKMTIESSTTGTPAVGSITYAVDIPNYAFILKIDNIDIPLVMIPSGNCPTSDFNSNALMVNNTDGEDATNTNGNFYHTIYLNKSTNEMTFPKAYDLVNHSQQADEDDVIDTSSCENGILQIPEEDSILFFTNNDGYIAQLINGNKEEIIYGLSQKLITAKSNFDADYYGFRYDATNTAKVEAVEFSCTNGVCDGKKLGDAVNNININLSNTVDNPATGFINGTINIGSKSGSIACAIDINTNNTTTKLIACIAQSPDDNTELYSLILASK